MKQRSVTRQQQTGLTMISWMLVFVFIGVIAMTVIRLFPVYLEHMGVKSSLNSLLSDQSLRGAGPSELRNALMRRIDVNDVDRVKSEDITIQRDGNVYRVNIAYEVVVPFIQNVSFLVTFDDTVEVGVR
jgi:hypothetical protein